MPNLRSANPLGALKIARICLPLVILALALLMAGPAFSKNNKTSENQSSQASEEPGSKKSPKAKSREESEGGGGEGGSEGGGEGGSEGGEGGEGESENPGGEENPEAPGSEEDPEDTTEPPEVELTSPPEDDDDDDHASSDDDDSVSFFIQPSTRKSQALIRYERTQKELARLFVLTEVEITVEFPDGGFDRALVQAANRARRAEKAYRRQ